MEKRSTPQERWAGNTPQRKLLESIFEGTIWEEFLRDNLEIAEAHELAELDDLLKAATGFYHMTLVHNHIDHEELAQVDRLLMALTDPVPPNGKAPMVGMAALRRASGFDTERISDILASVNGVVKINCLNPPANMDDLSLTNVTDCLRAEITEMSEVVTYRPSLKLHRVAGQIAALYGRGESKERVRVLQQHLSLDVRAPLHAVDSPALRAVLEGFRRHHNVWALRQSDGLIVPEAVLVSVLVGNDTQPPESIRETLACMSPEEIAEIEDAMVQYLNLFMVEYGAGEDFDDEPEAEPQLSWPLLPGLMQQLQDAPNGLGSFVSRAAGDHAATRRVIEELQEWHRRAPRHFYSEDADALLTTALSGENIDEATASAAIESLVTLFTTSIDEVNRIAAEERRALIDSFVEKTYAEAGDTDGDPDGEMGDVDDEDEDEDEEELEEGGEDAVEIERLRLAELAALATEEAAVADEAGGKDEPEEDELAELKIDDEPDLDDLDNEDERVVPSSPKRQSYVDATPWSTGRSNGWRPGGTVPNYDRPASDRATAYTSTGTPAITRTHVPSRFDEERIAAVTGRTLEAKPAEKSTYDWETLPENVADLTTLQVFEALLANVGVGDDRVTRSTSNYISGGDLSTDLLERDSIRRGFEAVRRQFEAFSRSLRDQDRSTVIHAGGTSALRYLLNGQLAENSRISAELDQLARHVLAYSHARQTV